MRIRTTPTAMTGVCFPSLVTPSQRRVRLTPKITNGPRVLPKRNRERHDAACDQCEPQISRRVWKIGGVGCGSLVQVFEVLDDREAKADQCHGCALPRHHRALDAEAGPDPGKVAVRRHPYFEPAWVLGNTTGLPIGVGHRASPTGRRTQRKPTWLVEVSTGSGCRAAGR